MSDDGGEQRRAVGRPESGHFDLERFVDAQDDRDTYERALRELRRGRKATHWMWFVFPQVAGLGQSATSRLFAIRSLDEAVAYLAHPVLGPRFREASRAVLVSPEASVEGVLGSVDAQKLRSSMTLFARAAPAEDLFQRVLDRWFDGETDVATEALLHRAP